VLPNFDELIDRAKKIKDIIWTDQDILKIVLPLLFK
jgi:peptidoglycan hydrolase CwlO-like protein